MFYFPLHPLLFELPGVFLAVDASESSAWRRNPHFALLPDPRAIPSSICQLHPQVLSNCRSRQLYDLSRERGSPSVLRAAAASGVPGAASAAYDEVEVRGAVGAVAAGVQGACRPPHLSTRGGRQRELVRWLHHSLHGISAQ